MPGGNNGELESDVFLSFGEIRSARIVRERMKVYSSQGGTATHTFCYVELELSGDTAPLAKALETEAAEKVLTEKQSQHWDI